MVHTGYQPPRGCDSRYRIAEKAIVRDGEIVAAPVLALSLSFDHRMIDGATAQNALNHIKRLLNDPQLILMEA